MQAPRASSVPDRVPNQSGLVALSPNRRRDDDDVVKSDRAAIRTRLLGVVGLLGVLSGGCAQIGSDATTSPTEQATTTVADSITTTVAESTTTVPSSITTTVDGVTVDPNLPSALSRRQVPWADVGAGWYLVLYDSSKAYPTDEADVREGPIVLYLVSSTGERYEMAAWEPGQYATLIDATETSALVARFEVNLDRTVYEFVDLITGASSIAYTVGFPESSLDIWPHASLTRPSGANVVVHRSDGSTEWLERRTPSGTVLSVIYEQTYVGGGRSMPWLYGPDGTSLVVARRDGISQVSNQGSLLAEPWTPPDTHCEPVRWWGADTFLAACFGQGPGSAPLDDNGQPHTFYGRLWLLETNGSPVIHSPNSPPSRRSSSTSVTTMPGQQTITSSCSGRETADHQRWPLSIPKGRESS